MQHRTIRLKWSETKGKVRSNERDKSSELKQKEPKKETFIVRKEKFLIKFSFVSNFVCTRVCATESEALTRERHTHWRKAAYALRKVLKVIIYSSIAVPPRCVRATLVSTSGLSLSLGQRADIIINELWSEDEANAKIVYMWIRYVKNNQKRKRTKSERKSCTWIVCKVRAAFSTSERDDHDYDVRSPRSFSLRLSASGAQRPHCSRVRANSIRWSMTHRVLTLQP